MTYEELQQTIEQSADDYMRRMADRNAVLHPIMREVYITGMYAMMGIIRNSETKL